MELQGKVALITGAARRIGREIARTLAGRGVSVLIHYHRSAKEALALQKEIEMLGPRAFLVSADLAKTKGLLAEIKRLHQQVKRVVPRVDILINNAAIFYPTPFGKISEKDWDAFLTVNLKAPFFLAQEIGAQMLKHKSGKIINLVDWVGFRPYSHYLPYSIAKAGLVAATKGLAKVLAPEVQVLGIAPGPILAAKGMSARQKLAATKRTLLKRFGDPSDIAAAVLFLLEDTDFMTGAVIPVEGGSLVA